MSRRHHGSELERALLTQLRLLETLRRPGTVSSYRAMPLCPAEFAGRLDAAYRDGVAMAQPSPPPPPAGDDDDADDRGRDRYDDDRYKKH